MLLLGAEAQQKLQLSLEDCINYALDNNEQIKIKEFEKYIADAEVRKIISIGLPQVMLNGDINHNFSVRKSIIDAELFGGSRGEETQFSVQQAYDGNVDFSVDQLIFDGSYFVGLQTVKTFKELSTKEHIKTQIDVVEAVSKAYYNSLITGEQLKLLYINLGRLDTLLYETDQMYQSGFAEKVDVDRIRVNYNNVKVEKSKLSQLVDVGNKLLKFWMGMDLDQPIILTEKLEDMIVETPVLPTGDFSYGYRIEFSQLETDKNLAFLEMKNNKAQYLPKFYASFIYGWNTAASGTDRLFNANRWLDFGAIGITVSVPIFDGFSQSNKIQQNKLQIGQIESQMTYLKKNIDLEIEQSQINLTSQLEMLDVRKQNLSLAQEVYDITKIKYQEGVGSNLEVINADASLKEAQTNYMNTLFEAITSQIELKKALGILYKNQGS